MFKHAKSYTLQLINCSFNHFCLQGGFVFEEMNAKLPMLLLLISFAIEFPDGKRCCVLQIASPSEERANWRFVCSKSESGGSFRVFLGEDWFAMIFAAASRDDIVATPAVTLGCIRLL